MGATQSVQELEDGDESEGEEEEEEEEEEEDDHNHEQSHIRQLESSNLLVKKVLEQEPEVLPCHASTSPLSPQLSTMGTPRLGPSIKVWDPYNVLVPPPPLPPPPVFARSPSMEDDLSSIKVYLINHGECDLNLRPDLVGGRCDDVMLTGNGKRQARALAVFLNSLGVRFSVVYCSPLDRASVCQLGSTAIGIKTKEGVVLAVEKRITSPLLEPNSVEKIMEIDEQIGCAMSGLIADAHTLVEHARVETQHHRFSYGEPMTVESTTQALCDLALPFGEGDEESMSRPFRVSLLIVGHDEHGPSLKMRGFNC